MFPGPHAHVYRNEAGEPVGWDYPDDGPPETDPYDDYDDDLEDDDLEDDDLGPELTPCPHCDQAAVVDDDGCCIHCGAPRLAEPVRFDPDGPRICPACGTNPAAPGDRYCTACGSATDRSSWTDGPR